MSAPPAGDKKPSVEATSAGGENKPPFGSSPVAQATPNAGMDAVAVQGIGAAITMLQNLLAKVGATSEPGRAVLDALKTLVKAVPAGTVSPASQNATLQQAQMANTQNGAMQQKLLQTALGAQGGGARPQPGSAAPGAMA